MTFRGYLKFSDRSEMLEAGAEAGHRRFHKLAFPPFEWAHEEEVEKERWRQIVSEIMTAIDKAAVDKAIYERSSKD